MIGTYALSSGYYDAYYNRALKVRALIKRDFDEAFKKCDVIACPTSPTPAFKVGEKSGGDPLQMYLVDGVYRDLQYRCITRHQHPLRLHK